jgi:hypothetical protein
MMKHLKSTTLLFDFIITARALFLNNAAKKLCRKSNQSASADCSLLLIKLVPNQ